MNVPRLVLRNITGRRGRFVFTLLGITVGIGSLVALLTIGDNLRNEVNRKSSDLGANLLVTPKGWCAYEEISVLTGEQLPEALPIAEVQKITAINGISAVPYLTEKTAIQNNPVPVVGILPDAMKVFRGWEVSSGRYFNVQDEQGVIIGAGLAQQFNLGIADMLTIRGLALPVIGILKPAGNSDDNSIFMPLPVAQELYATEGNVSFLAVKVADISKINDYVAEIEAAANVAVVSDQQLLRSVLSLVGTVSLTLQLIAVVAVVAAAFGIINTMMTAVYERRRDIGILETLGAKSGAIFRLFLYEAIAYGLAGGLLGIGVGTLFSYLASPYIGQNEFTALFKGASAAVNLTPGLFFELMAFSIVVSALSGLYPAWRASRLTPIEAMRYE